MPPVTMCGCWSRAVPTARSSTAAFATCRSSSRRAIWSSSTPRRRFRPPSLQRARTASGSSYGSRRLRATRIPNVSGSSSSAAVTHRSAASASTSSSSFRAAARRGSSRPTPASGCGSPGSTSRYRSRRTSQSTAADSLRLRAAALAALGVPERLRDRARQRRDAERGTSLHGRADHRARRGRRARRADHPAHRRLVAGAPRAPVPRALSRPGAHGAAGERGAPVGRPRDRHRHDRRPRARDGRPARTGRSTPAKAGRTSSSPPSEVFGRSTAC